MSLWYRVFPNENPQATFSRDSGLYVAGRWHYLGKKVIYCSQSIALCTLEWLSHHGLSVSGFNYYRYSIEIPDNLIAYFSITALPQDWQCTPATDLTRDFSESHLFTSSKILAIA